MRPANNRMEYFTRADLIQRGFDTNSTRTKDYLFKTTKYGSMWAKCIGENTYEIHAAYNAQGEHLDTLEINGDLVGIIDTLDEFEALIDDPTKTKRDMIEA